MARKITENKDESIIRLSDGAFEQVLINKSKGKFYYIGENAVKFIDNSKGKMLISNYKSIDKMGIVKKILVAFCSILSFATCRIL